MKSKAGSILLMISGILTLLFSLLLIVFSILIFTGVVKGEGSVGLGGALVLVIAVVLLVLSLLKFWASGLMKDEMTTVKGGIIALIVGILTGGDLLAIIGGILGIVQGKE
jgi:phosphotransferase system  glucose/maltose/N-acetylglucosamine-specific IIC component